MDKFVSQERLYKKHFISKATNRLPKNHFAKIYTTIKASQWYTVKVSPQFHREHNTTMPA